MAGLVDYSSEDEESSQEGADEKSTRRTEKASSDFVAPSAAAPASSASVLPPLPHAFHDLYASTVRAAPADDPALHQGRTRAIPHVAGQWPSHIYIEWFPSPAEHARLSGLLASLRDALGGADPQVVHSFLTSDLGAPLPLHISLSRPFVLSTADKAAFLAGLVDAVAGAHVVPFDIAFMALDWYRGPDSARAFLVLRVETATPPETKTASPAKNQPLVALLRRCNERVAAAGQPVLYAGRGSDDNAGDEDVHSAFHVSLAWTLAEVTPEWVAATQQAYAAWQGSGDICIRVDSVKAKIGNVVTDIPLARERRAKQQRGGGASRGPGRGLFGV